MAVSHQWFIQWSTPSMVFTDITKRYEESFSRWNSEWNHGDPKSHYSGYPREDPWRRPVAPAPVYENEYEIEYEEEDDLGYNDRTKVTGLALWLAVMGVAHTQYVPADIETIPFDTLYKWRQIDFAFPSAKKRREAINTKKFIPGNVLPLGLEVWKDRVFITLPYWRKGVPATLASVPRSAATPSPQLMPYPDWSYHAAFANSSNKCAGLTSVFRVNVDPCGRLWVLDSGQINSESRPQQACPPSIVVFDLATDTLYARYYIPKIFVLQDSLFSNIIVDTRYEDCSDLHVYIADTWRFGLLVFRESDKQFWRFSHHLFYPDPLASNYTLHGLNFQWADGILGLALSPIRNTEERILYFHSMSSFREFFVSTEVLQDPNRVNSSLTEFNTVGESRGNFGQASASAIDRRGVMFYGLVTKDSIGCWDTKQPYKRSNMGTVAMNSETLIFPNDLKVDQEPEQSVWVLTNRLPQFQAGETSPLDYNYRILHANTKDAVRGSVCDPSYHDHMFPSDVLRKWIH